MNQATVTELPVFIDTNIYLDFYGQDPTNGREMLASLLGIMELVFVSEQIVVEIERNRCQCYLGFIQTFHCPAVGHIENALRSSLLADEAVEEDGNRVVARLKELYSTMHKRGTERIAEVAAAKDPISMALAGHFERAASPSPGDIEAATSRKARGNAPGKPQDPLGDQLSWEQFLAQLVNATTVVVVSKDADFVIRNGQNGILHPSLRRELTAKLGAEIDIFATANLRSAIEHIKTSKLLERAVVPPAPRPITTLMPPMAPMLVDAVTFPAGSLGPSPDRFLRLGQSYCTNCGGHQSLAIDLESDAIRPRYVCISCGKEQRHDGRFITALG